MNLQEFKEGFFEHVKLSAVAEGTTDKEEFLNYAAYMLTEAEEFEDFVLLPFEGVSGVKKIQIDGYAYNDLDEFLTLFIVPPLTYTETVTLTSAEAERYFSRARAFVEHSKFIISHAEESSPGYGLAVDIQKRYSDARKYCIYLITDMVMSKSIKELYSTTLNGKEVEYHIWDISRLYQLAESRSGKEDIVINLKEVTPFGIPCLAASQTEDYVAYLCNIPGTVLAKLYNQYGGRLLEGNVRSFLQTKGKVNKGIRNTILNNPDMFFAYNNGIAATASAIKTDNETGIMYITEITALQIVNGGQTTASLATALLNDRRDGSEEKIKRICVPMKLSIVSPEKVRELIPNISRYANSQNKVSDSDLWSNHPFHIRIEELSRRIIAPAIDGKQYGTHWYYERANGQYKQETYKSTDAERRRFEMQNPKSQMFTKTDLSKFVNLRKLLPHTASAGGQKSFSKLAEWISVQWEKNDIVFNEGFFKEVVAMAIVFRQSDRIVIKQSWYNSYKANIVTYTIAKILHTVETKYREFAIDYKSIWLKQSLSSAWVNQIEVLSKIIYEFIIDKDRAVENVTEWAKREACWEQAKRIEISLMPTFISELIYKEVAEEQEKDEKADQKLTNKVNSMVAVANFGIDNWKDLVRWNAEHNVLSPIDMSFINSAIAMEKGIFPSEKQCAKILEVLEKARFESYAK